MTVLPLGYSPSGTKANVNLDTIAADLAALSGDVTPPFGTVTSLPTWLANIAPFSVKNYGAVGDGVADDTAAFVAAYNAVSATNGGEIYVPPGIYKMNLTVTKPGVRLRGAGGFGGVGNATCFSYLTPADTTIPVLSIGDGTTLCNGFSLDTIAIQGPVGAHYGVKINGATNCSYRNFGIQGFDTFAIFLTSSATQSTSYQFFSHFAIDGRAGANCVGIDVLNGGTFTSALFFANGAITSSNPGIAAMRSDGCTVRLENMWVQVVISGTGLNSKNNARFLMHNVQIDSNLSTDVLLTVDSDTAVQNAFSGNFICDGVMSSPGGNTAQLTGTTNWLAFQAFVLDPYINGKIFFTDTSLAEHAQYDPTDQTVFIERIGTQLIQRAPQHSIGGASDNIGLYGVPAVARQLLATGAGHTVDDVITALQAVGLLRQS